MSRNWDLLNKEFNDRIASAPSLQVLEQLRIELLGKKGSVNALMQEMKNLLPEERKDFGMAVNNLKKSVETAIAGKMTELKENELNEKLAKEKIDITLPASDFTYGTLHPLTIVQQEIEDIFVAMGYAVVEGPEVEFDVYNFEKANIPADHPARDMQDTFYVDVERLLRTQTTAIQMRVLEAQGNKLPIKVICPGKVYRRDDDDATHSHQFTQIEGLVVGEGITQADLKGTLELFARSMFGPQREIRLRQSYFPFTEPSQEIDVSCHVCGGKGCPTCKGTGWIEILGSGMVHPHVLDMAGIDSTRYSGFAFGIGVERTAMLKYGIDDIRNLYLNNLKFLKNYKRFD
ncbi:MAG: phenylalanine--tRNA ligase subunit alpha [Erysipelotrichaceae bacterium]|nr:phenylalanine--tRNA ligase subunit alpha [Erysipelotrichaceae bacterium]